MRMCASRGTHVVLKNDCLPKDTGIILNDTSDGRLIFILPYQDHMLIGTTDDMQEVAEYPRAAEADVEFIKNEVQRIFGDEFDFDSHLKSKFAGLRPLCLETPIPQEEYEEKVKTLKSKDLCRSHIIDVSDSGLISLLGGKWTSYRVMGEETVSKAITTHHLNNIINEESKVSKLKLLGCYSKLELRDNMALGPQEVATKYKNQLLFLQDIPVDISERLIENYGPGPSLRIIEKGGQTPAFGIKQDKNKEFKGANVRIHPDFPILESELYHHMDNEMAVRPDDIINRRLGLSFVDQKAADEVSQKVVDIMASHLKWSSSKKKEELERVKERIDIL
mmetsp:Transcript_18472/g.18147  ORF Transcript_18472/g.18147 Transcript_18472/m.18147 type:complete len:335 (-) Transcript_18472:37-1041(-)